MKVTVLMKKGAIVKLTESQTDALSMTASEVLTRTINAAVIPFNKGTMQNESTFVYEGQLRTGVVSIVTDTPYAKRMYMHPEFNFQTENNANARGEWWADYITGSKKKEVKAIFSQMLALTGRRYIK